MRYVARLIASSVAGAAFLAAMPARSFEQAAEHHMTRAERESRSVARPIFERDLPNAAGKSLLAVEVVYPPGGASPPHRHPASAFIYIYVVSGAIVSAVDDGRPRLYQAGESFYESPGAHHWISRNASRTKPAKLLAVFVKDSGKAQLVSPDAR
jgi:quercetin dioxygenase-like cupin family protein